MGGDGPLGLVVALQKEKKQQGLIVLGESMRRKIRVHSSFILDIQQLGNMKASHPEIEIQKM